MMMNPKTAELLRLSQHGMLKTGEFEEYLLTLISSVARSHGIFQTCIVEWDTSESMKILLTRFADGSLSCSPKPVQAQCCKTLRRSLETGQPTAVLGLLGKDSAWIQTAATYYVPLWHESSLLGYWVYSCSEEFDSVSQDILAGLISQAVDGIALMRKSPGISSVFNEHEVVLDFVPALIWYTDLNGTLLRINQAALEVTGLHLEEAQGLKMRDVWPSYYQRFYCEHEKLVLQSGLPVLGEIEELESLDGPAVWIKSDKIPHRGRSGRIMGMFTFAVDITSLKESEEALGRYNEQLEDKVRARTVELATEIRERQKFEDALRESSQKYEQLFSTVSDPILVYELETRRIVDVNEAAKQVYDCDQETFLQRTLDDLNGDDLLSNPMFEAFDADSVRLPPGWQLQKRRDGLCFPATISGGMFTHNQQTLGVAVVREMSQDLRARLQLEGARVAAEKATRSKSEFLANVSHEIRTPMNAILGFCELLEASDLPEKERGWVSAIANSGQTLLALINDILDLSRIEAGGMQLNLEEVDLKRVVHEVAAMFEHAAQSRGIQLEVSVDGSLQQKLILDEVRMRQILVNLVGNAVKFTEEGFVRVQVKQTRAHETHLDLSIVVEDSGIGIPLEQQEAIFEAFRQQSGQSTRKYGGTGLGLSITRRLVEMMGGSIRLDSQLNEGTRFEVRLFDVARESEAEECSEAYLLSTRIEFERSRILIVDDLDLNRQLAFESLRDTGLMMEGARSGREAIQILAHQKFQLVLLDIRLEDMDGREVAASIREVHGRDIVILSWTAAQMSEDELFDGCLFKPCRRPDMIGEFCRHLPFRMLPKEDEPSDVRQDEVKEVEEVPAERIREALPFLKGELMQSWEKAMETCIISEIESFSRDMAKLSREMGCEALTQYANHLVELSDAFDIENLTLELGRFPGLIQTFESRLEEMES